MRDEYQKAANIPLQALLTTTARFLLPFIDLYFHSSLQHIKQTLQKQYLNIDNEVNQLKCEEMSKLYELSRYLLVDAVKISTQ